MDDASRAGGPVRLLPETLAVLSATLEGSVVKREGVVAERNESRRLFVGSDMSRSARRRVKSPHLAVEQVIEVEDFLAIDIEAPDFLQNSRLAL